MDTSVKFNLAKQRLDYCTCPFGIIAPASSIGRSFCVTINFCALSEIEIKKGSPDIELLNCREANYLLPN